MSRQEGAVLHHVDKSFWKHVEKIDDGSMGCKFCGCLFPKATSVSRIKFHLAGLTGRGVRICGQVPQDVQDAALAAIDGPLKKKLETGAGSSNNEVTNTISSLAQQQNNEMMMAHQREDLSLEDWMASSTDEDEEPLVIGSFHERPSFNQADEPHVDRSFWEYAEQMDDGRMGCKFCGCLFPKATSVSRIKFHLAGLTGRGVRVCGQVPQDVQDAALAAIDGPPEKKLETGAGSSNNEVTNTISSLAQQQNNEMMMAHQREDLSLEDWMANITDEDEEPLVIGNFHERPSFNQADEPHVDRSFWEYAEKMDDGRMGCKFCGCLFPKATSISRIKFHLAGLTGRGVRICGQVPQDVQDATLAAIDGPLKKKVKTGAGSGNNEVTNAISSLAQQQNNEMMMAHQREDLSLEDLMASSTDEDEEPLVIGSFHERPSFNQADEPHVDRSFWEYAEKMDDGRMGCKFCGCLFPKATSVSRIKFHLAGLTRRGVRICGQVPQDVQDAALAAIDGPLKKKLKTGAG